MLNSPTPLKYFWFPHKGRKEQEMTTVSVHYTFHGFAFMNHWETFDTVDVARAIMDAEHDTSIDMYVIGGVFHRKA